MRRLNAPLTLVLTLCLGFSPIGRPSATISSAESTPATVWMTIQFADHKIGYLKTERVAAGGIVTTTQTLSLDLDRNGKHIRLGNMIRSMETEEGQPLGFSTSTTLSTMASTVHGQRRADGQFDVISTVGNDSHNKQITWPAGALLVEGQRQVMIAQSGHTGARYVLHEFNPATQEVVSVHMQVVGDETVDLPDGRLALNHQRQTLRLAHGKEVIDLWLDSSGMARMGKLELLGLPLEMLACSRACALAPSQNVDMLRAAVIDSPRLLPQAVRETPLRYWVHMTNGAAFPFIDTGEQHVTQLLHGDWLIDVSRAIPNDEPPPTPLDSTPNAWLQSDATAIRTLAAQAVGKATNARNKMRRLLKFANRYITSHGLDVGYASALEVASTRRGDCTEYAVFLAAMARAEGIPSRVVTGLVYTGRFDGMSRVFVPHAWTQAWVDGRWQSYDAALGHFDYSHLALAVSDGNPWHFFSATQIAGHMRIDLIRPDYELVNTGPTSLPGPPSGKGASGGRGR
jgi:hypothetical protein